MKRTICKRCGTVLLPNVSSDMDIVSEANGKREVCEIECKNCKFVKRFVINEKYKLWVDQSVAIKEVVQPNND